MLVLKKTLTVTMPFWRWEWVPIRPVSRFDGNAKLLTHMLEALYSITTFYPSSIFLTPVLFQAFIVSSHATPRLPLSKQENTFLADQTSRLLAPL